MISMIVAVDRNWGIGRENKMLADIKPDLTYFMNTTLGSPVVMGYNTFLSIQEESRPLPGRDNIILSRRPLKIEGVTIIHSIDDLFKLIEEKYPDEEVFVIGGESVYKQMLPYADKLYITHIFRKFANVETHFPMIGDEWRLKDLKAEEENISHEYPHMFATYTKV